jgi:hypothetical protein
VLDKGGRVKTVPVRVSLVSKVDNGKGGQIRASKNKWLVPFSGTIKIKQNLVFNG